MYVLLKLLIINYLYLLMKIPYHFKIMLLWKYYLNNQKNQKLIKMNNNATGSKSILYFLPDNKKESQIVNYLIQDSIQKNQSIYYFCKQDSLINYKNNSHENFIIYQDSDLNNLGFFNNMEIIDHLNSLECDALVDLNLSFNPVSLIISYELKYSIKIGFKSDVSDKIFNIILEKNKKALFEKNFQIIKQLLYK